MINTKLSAFTTLLLDENTRQNLTRITDPAEIQIKHFSDSLKLLPFLPSAGSVLDIGTGAGFPSVPLAIARPQLQITALDSLGKRINFLQTVKTELPLENLHPIHARAEELAHSPEYREQYDTAVSRAVANLAALCEYCLPFVRVGGSFIAMKGKSPEPEITTASHAISQLGGALKQVIPYTLPDIENHCLVIIEKVKPTPQKYPRRRVNIAKNPL